MANATMVNTDAATEPAAAELPRDQRAMAAVKKYALWSAGAGVLPLPVVDMAALVAVQLRMLSKMAQVYEVPFMENGVKSIVTTLLGTIVSTSVGASLGSMMKAIPFVGPLLGIAAVPSMYSAATYAIGRVFISHFEAGGTFLDFDPEKTRAYFLAEFEKAKQQPDSAKAA
jgi:uncharacterized protein (DUF697 family)